MRKKTKVFIGDGAFPELFVKYHTETNDDFITRVVVSSAISFWRLFLSEDSVSEIAMLDRNDLVVNIHVEGFLSEQILAELIKLLDIGKEFMKQVVERKGELYEKWLTFDKNEERRVENLIYWILSAGEKK